MSDSGVYAFPTKLDDYNTNAKDQYLCALLPEEAKDIGVDQELGIRWSLEKDGSEAWFLRGESTDGDGRLVRSAQPGGDAAAEFKIAIPPEFYRSRENSPVFEMGKGDEVILEINKRSDPHFRVYKPSDYFDRQSLVNPRIKAPAVAGAAYQIYKNLVGEASEFEGSSEDQDYPYRVTFNIFEGGDDIMDRVKNAQVRLEGKEKTTNSFGRARFDVGVGQYKAEASVGGETIEKTAVVSERTADEHGSVHIYFEF